MPAAPSDLESARDASAAGVTLRRNLLLAVAVLALALRLVHVSQIAQAPFADLRLGDAAAYHRWALEIVDGDWVGQGVFYQAPLYPYFLAVVYAVFGDSPAMVRFVQAVIGTGACTLLAAAGMALFGPAGAMAGVLLAVFPTAIFLDGLLEKSALVTFFTAALLWLLASRQTRGRALLTGVVLGLLALTRENALLLVVPVLAWVLLGGERAPANGSDRTRRWAWPATAACAVGCALVLLPVGARNYAVGGAFHLTTSQFGPNFYIGNHAGARGLYEPLVEGHGAATDERDDAVRLAETAAGRSLSADEVSSVLDRAGPRLHPCRARRLARPARAQAGAGRQRGRDRRHRGAGSARRVVVSYCACSRRSASASSSSSPSSGP